MSAQMPPPRPPHFLCCTREIVSNTAAPSCHLFCAKWSFYAVSTSSTLYLFPFAHLVFSFGSDMDMAFSLANLRYGFSLKLCLEGQHSRASSLLVFYGYCLIIWQLRTCKATFLKLEILMLLSTSTVVHRGLPHLVFWLKLVCTVLWCVVHTFVGYLQFLVSFLHGIALIRTITDWCISEFWWCRSDAPDSQVAQRWLVLLLL